MPLEIIPIEKLNASTYNPRKDLNEKDPEYKNIKKSIDEFGYVDPIVWNKRTGNIVGGHQRFKVLKAQGRKELEVSVVDLDVKKEKLLNLALNKIKGDWEFTKLADMLQELDTGEIDMSITGFGEKELEQLMNYVPKYDEKEIDILDTKNKCPKCNYEW